MDISIWAIIIAGGGVLISMAALGFTIYWNIHQDRRTKGYNERIEKLEKQRHELEQRKQRDEWYKSQPYLSITHKSSTGGPWLSSAELLVKNTGGGPAVSVKLSGNQGQHAVRQLNQLAGLSPGDEKLIRLKFDIPNGFNHTRTPVQPVLLKAVLKRKKGKPVEINFKWEPSSNDTIQHVSDNLEALASEELSA